MSSFLKFFAVSVTFAFGENDNVRVGSGFTIADDNQCCNGGTGCLANTTWQGDLGTPDTRYIVTVHPNSTSTCKPLNTTKGARNWCVPVFNAAFIQAANGGVKFVDPKSKSYVPCLNTDGKCTTLKCGLGMEITKFQPKPQTQVFVWL